MEETFSGEMSTVVVFWIDKALSVCVCSELRLTLTSLTRVPLDSA